MLEPLALWASALTCGSYGSFLNPTPISHLVTSSHGSIQIKAKMLQINLKKKQLVFIEGLDWDQKDLDFEKHDCVFPQICYGPFASAFCVPGGPPAFQPMGHWPTRKVSDYHSIPGLLTK